MCFILFLSGLVDWDANACGFKCFFVLDCHVVVSCWFEAILWIGSSAFVHGHVGFKGFSGLKAALMCTGIWFLRDFIAWEL